jgi:hypothetical protein
MSNNEILKQLEKERLELESEFIQLGKEIKNCKDSETRTNLQELKKEIQFDLDDVKIQIEEIKNNTNEQQTKKTEDGIEKP